MEQVKCKYKDPVTNLVCNREVANSYLLTHISRFHENKQMDFVCNFCTRSFQTLKSLSNHEGDHEKGLITHYCLIDNCGQGFLEPKNLLCHQVKKHGKEPGGSIEESEGISYTNTNGFNSLSIPNLKLPPLIIPPNLETNLPPTMEPPVSFANSKIK